MCMTEPQEENNGTMDILKGETCPLCLQKTLTLVEEEREIPHFGLVYLFSMTCESPDCGFHKSDLESAETKKPTSQTIEIDSEDDMNIRVVKSASATVKIPRMITMESSETSDGFITNVEGLLNRFKAILESVRDNSDDNDEIKKAKNHLKKLQRAIWGQEKLTIIIEDSTGTSAIISDKTVVKPFKKK